MRALLALLAVLAAAIARAPRAPSTGSARADVIAELSEGKAVRFASGFEVLVYAFGASADPLGKTQHVVLLNPSGVAAKSRLRPAPRAPE